MRVNKKQEACLTKGEVGALLQLLGEFKHQQDHIESVLGAEHVSETLNTTLFIWVEALDQMSKKQKY